MSPWRCHTPHTSSSSPATLPFSLCRIHFLLLMLTVRVTCTSLSSPSTLSFKPYRSHLSPLMLTVPLMCTSISSPSNLFQTQVISRVSRCSFDLYVQVEQEEPAVPVDEDEFLPPASMDELDEYLDMLYQVRSLLACHKLWHTRQPYLSWHDYDILDSHTYHDMTDSRTYHDMTMTY